MLTLRPPRAVCAAREPRRQPSILPRMRPPIHFNIVRVEHTRRSRTNASTHFAVFGTFWGPLTKSCFGDSGRDARRTRSRGRPAQRSAGGPPAASGSVPLPLLVATRKGMCPQITQMDGMNRIQKRQTGTGPSRLYPVNPVILSLSAISVSGCGGEKADDGGAIGFAAQTHALGI